MKNFLLLLSIFFTLSVSAQTISGNYSGTKYNDSTKKTEHFELALSEYRGKITGFAYSTYIVNDVYYYSVKRVKASRKNNQLVVEDDEMLVNNFPEAPAKRVHQTTYIQLTNEDTLHQANGEWETNRTRNFYPLHGSVALKLDNDSARSMLVAQLKELGVISQDNHQTGEPIADVRHVNEEKPKSKEVKETKEKTATASTEKTKAAPAEKPAIAAAKEPAVLPYEQRKTTLIQTIDITSDSLQIAFYDNGVIDGDSISVYINDKNIISHNKLTATATKKTISTAGFGDEIRLVVVADNLGSIPPNTGLVVIKDGEQTYQLNFRADMQTNASIVLRKRK
ncbi:MAG TPA: hypothetical protein VNS32_06760 [Flavisolibacter sp.]|nr:hypothetical protein [Flavisolibacter sp.]